jgi:murein DD-endopeptidase MepM/ murein hydrolase activator NlpD
LFVRQRLSSEPDRYRGRRRVPTPPRSRYAVVGVSAFVGAGVVALGAAHNMPNPKAVNPTVLANLENASAASGSIADRDNANAPASRGEDRSAAKTDAATEANPNDVWLLPLDQYEFTAPFGVRFGKLHAGIDLAAAAGTPYKAIHAGVVTSAGYDGGYGIMVTVKNPDGTETVYAHSRRLFVKTGDTVKAGQVIGEVGMTGYSYGTHLHLEIHVGGTPVDPIKYLRDHGVDIKLGVESSLAISADAAS